MHLNTPMAVATGLSVDVGSEGEGRLIQQKSSRICSPLQVLQVRIGPQSHERRWPNLRIPCTCNFTCIGITWGTHGSRLFCRETSVSVTHVDVTLTPTSVLLKTTSAFNKNNTPAAVGQNKNKVQEWTEEG